MSGTTTSKNLGMISAVKTGPNQPNNTNLIWYDTNFLPPKKKAFDTLSQDWIEIIFLPSPANITKKLIVKKTGYIDQAIYLQDEDVFIKTNSTAVDTFVNLPLANANFEGKSFKLVNLHSDSKKIMYNQPIISVGNSEITEQEAGLTFEIVCTEKVDGNGIYVWYLIDKNSI